MPRTTAKQRLEQAHYEGYCKGRREEQELSVKQRQEFEQQMRIAKGSQIVAVTELIKATTANLSKAGYLIGKLNGEKGW